MFRCFSIADLLIAANKLNPVFQNDCLDIFNKDVLGVACKYTPAPIKTKDRCKIKAAVDYTGHD